MSTVAPAGISAGAEWQSTQVGTGDGQPLTLTVVPDAANAEFAASGRPEVFYALPAAPHLARGADNRPALSLTLLLSRRPDPAEETVYPLIERAILAFDVTLAIPEAAHTGTSAMGNREYRPLFARSVTVQLLSGGSEELAAFMATGPSARGSLNATLARPDALSALGAIDGNPSDLRVRASVSYRTAEPDQTLRLHGSWAAVYDALQAQPRPDGMLTRADVQAAFDQMVAAGTLQVIADSGAGQRLTEADPSLFGAFWSMSSVVLNRETPQMDSSDPENKYSLRDRPNPFFTLDYTQTVSGDRLASRVIEAPLDDVLGGCLDGLEREAYIHLVSPAASPAGGGVAPVPRRVRAMPPSRTPRGPGGAQALSYAASAGRIEATASVLRPARSTYRPAELLVSDAVSPAVSTTGAASPAGAAIGPIRDHWVHDPVLIDPGAPHWINLPVVADSSAPLWPDRLDASLFWYAPAFQLVQPAPNEDPGASPFLFTYQVTGATASGKRALSATVRCKLAKAMRPETQAALRARGNPTAQPVPTPDISVSLDLPFVDDRDGQTKSQMLPMAVEQQGDTIIATLNLLNDWVGLCYGALAQAGFQSRPAQLRVAFAFDAYVPVQPDRISVVFGGKEALTPIRYSVDPGRPLDGRPYLSASDMVYHFPQGELRFQSEARTTAPVPAAPAMAAGLARSEDRAGGMALMARPGVAAAAVSQPAHVPMSPAASAAHLAIRPGLLISPGILHVIDRTQYAQQTMVREESEEALYPCSSLGAFYREDRPEGSVAVGCRDALQLGQTTWQQYEEVMDLRDPFYKVHRSLQQPGQFLVVPAYYRISRYAPSEKGAYRPIVYLYTVADPDVATNSRVILQASLQPDIPLYVRRALLARLSAYAQRPEVVYPTQIECGIEAMLAVDSGIGEKPEIVRMPDSFQVSVPTDIPGARLLRSRLETDGLFGSVTFKLPDGSILTSNLALELTNITGPWESGPVEVVLDGGTARFTNRIESDVAVSDLALYSSGSSSAAGVAGPVVSVEAALAQDASASVPLPAPTDEALAVYTVQPGTAATLAEVRTFIEDIHTNVIFLDQITHADHGLSALQIQARMDNVDGTYTVQWVGPVGSIDILLPLTVQLDQRLLHYQVTRTMDSGEVSTTDWLPWDLAQGNIIGLTWPAIQ